MSTMENNEPEVGLITYIYSLSDPVTKEIKYIGQTVNPKQRELSHYYNCNSTSAKMKWIKSLKLNGRRPLFEILDIVEGGDYDYWENFYIELFRSFGCALFNRRNHFEGDNWHEILITKNLNL